MVDSAAVDNDILLKLAHYGLLNSTAYELCTLSEKIYILGAAKFVVRSLLSRGKDSDPTKLADFNDFLVTAIEVEPTLEEVSLATRIEEYGVRNNLNLDIGESQLCAVAIYRTLDVLITGDKRAIVGFQGLIQAVPEMRKIAGRVACLEQLMWTIIGQIGVEAVRENICGKAATDRTMSICLGCTRPSIDQESIAEAFSSYIEHLRSVSPEILRPGAHLA